MDDIQKTILKNNSYSGSNGVLEYYCCKNALKTALGCSRDSVCESRSILDLQKDADGDSKASDARKCHQGPKRSTVKERNIVPNHVWFIG